MTQPLALVVYENLMPGSQIINRLRDLNWRVQALPQPDQLIVQAEAEKPVLVLMDLNSTNFDMCALIGELKTNPATGHLPVLAFAGQKNRKLQDAARNAGATLVAGDAQLLDQLPLLLDKVLEIE